MMAFDEANYGGAVTLDGLRLSELRAYRAELEKEEERVSYWRRLIQARLDVLNASAKAQYLSEESLKAALGETGSGARRQQLLSVEAASELPALPEVGELWSQHVDVNDDDAREQMCKALAEAEERLSAYRHALHKRIDAAKTELIGRYKSDHDLTLDLLPGQQGEGVDDAEESSPSNP